MISKNTIFVILSFLAGLSLMFVFNRQAIKVLREEKGKCEIEKNQIKNIKNTVTRPLTKQEIYLLADKVKKMEEYKPQKLSFTSEIIKKGSDLITVDIKIEGDKNSLFDAADLRIDFNDGIQIVDIKKGQVFTSYPQLSVKGASIIVTGIASLKENSLDFGKVGERFITITLKKIKPKATLTIMKEGSNIYLMGESVVDTNKELQIQF